MHVFPCCLLVYINTSRQCLRPACHAYWIGHSHSLSPICYFDFPLGDDASVLVLSPTGPARVHRSGKAVGPLAEVASQSIVPYKTALSLCHRPLLCYFHALQCCQRYHFFHRGGWRWWRCRGRRRRGTHLRKPPHPAPSFGPMIRALFAYLFPTCLPPAPFQPHLQRHHTCVLVLIFKVICNQTVHPPFRFFYQTGIRVSVFGSYL